MRPYLPEYDPDFDDHLDHLESWASSIPDLPRSEHMTQPSTKTHFHRFFNDALSVKANVSGTPHPTVWLDVENGLTSFVMFANTNDPAEGLDAIEAFGHLVLSAVADTRTKVLGPVVVDLGTP